MIWAIAKVIKLVSLAIMSFVFMTAKHKYHITFEELAMRGAQVLAKQGPVTYKQALAQINRIMSNSKGYNAYGQIYRNIKSCGDNAPKLQQILDDHMSLFVMAKGSTHNHQAWPGGYLQHVADCMTIARRLLNNTPPSWPVPFSLGSVVLVLFLHDIEKPFMQKRMAADPEMRLWSDQQRMAFRRSLMAEYKIAITEEEDIALTHIHGEGGAYSSKQRVMNELGALCHAADVLSSRLWWNRNNPKNI